MSQKESKEWLMRYHSKDYKKSTEEYMDMWVKASNNAALWQLITIILSAIIVSLVMWY